MKGPEEDVKGRNFVGLEWSWKSGWYFKQKYLKNHPWRPSPAARECIGFPLPNKRIDSNDIPPALTCVSKVTCEVHLTENILIGNLLHTPLLCYSLRKEWHKKTPWWILQEQLNVALEERLSYGRPRAWWDCTCNGTNKARKRNLDKQELFSRELFSFHHSSCSAHFNSWGTSLPLVEADSGPYIPRLNWVPSIICPRLEQEETVSKPVAKTSSHQ